MFKAWNQWRSWAEEMRRQQYLMKEAIWRLINRQHVYSMGAVAVHRCHVEAKGLYTGWQLTAYTQQRAINGMEEGVVRGGGMKRQEMLLRRGLMRILLRLLAAVVCTWREVAADRKRQQYMMGGAIHRLMFKKLSAAWEKWQYKAAVMKHQKALM